MTTGLIIGIALLALLAVVGVAVTLRRRDTKIAFGQMTEEPSKELVTASATQTSAKELERSAQGGTPGAIVPADSGPPAVYIPPDAETIGVARRQFLNRSILSVGGFGLGVFGLSIIAFLWPSSAGGFGSRVNVGRIGDIKAGIAAGGGFMYFPEGKMWLTEYPSSALPKAQSAYTGFYDQVEPGLQAGVVALFQTCPHLGCRVPECATSQWFECPCHGSQYNQVGEKKAGPAPRGMDRFPMEVTAADELVVNTGIIIQGPAIGTNTTGQEAEGPNCLGAAGGH